MNRIHQDRLFVLILFLIGLTLAVGLILYSLKQNLNVFVTPTDLAQKTINHDYTFRLGGMVKKGSVQRDPKTLNIKFIVTDFKHETVVHYAGVLPDLFRENSGVVIEGKLNPLGQVNASQVLAKHDENYMPAPIYKKMRDNNSGQLPA